MQLRHTLDATAATWLFIAAVVAIFTAPLSVGATALLAFIGLLPPMLMLRRWNGPAQTLSESIHEARR